MNATRYIRVIVRGLLNTRRVPGRFASRSLAILLSFCASAGVAVSPAAADDIAIRLDPPVGRVIAFEAGEAIVELGLAHGLRLGDRIELFRERREQFGAGDSAVSRERIAIGLVTGLSRLRAKVRVGIDEVVPVGTYAQPTPERTTSSLSAPPRPAASWEAEIRVRPFLAVNELGGGVLGSLSLGFRSRGNFHLQALLDPVAYAAARDAPKIVAGGAGLIASFDSRHFEIGLGLGGQTVNSPTDVLNPGSGVTIYQAIRIGPVDGSNFAARSNVVLFHSQFEFRGLTASLQFALERGVWLFVGGGGGDVGSAYGEIGGKVLVQGNGDRGSLFLSASVGSAAMFIGDSCEENLDGFHCTPARNYIGPMISLGAEWRL